MNQISRIVITNWDVSHPIGALSGAPTTRGKDHFDPTGTGGGPTPVKAASVDLFALDHLQQRLAVVDGEVDLFELE